MNISDGERVSAELEKFGLVHEEKREKADMLVVMTCGVREGAENRVYGIIPKIKKRNANVKIVLSGCLSQRPDVRKRLQKFVDIWLPTPQITQLAQILGLEDEGSLKSLEKDYLNLGAKYGSLYSAFVPIGNGCNNFCTYCVVPHSRGLEIYRDAREILNEIEILAQKNYKEITLIAQNVNSYKSESDGINYNFPKLLRAVSDILNKISPQIWLRFSTSHPKDMSDDLITVLRDCQNICEHIHLPVQSGDNEILNAMNRKYTVEHYKNLIKKIRAAYDEKSIERTLENFKFTPKPSITTDIIVGFPNETETQFQNTVALFNDVKFDMAYISQYSPRPFTAAYNLQDNITPEEKKQREQILSEILTRHNFENNQQYINQTIQILIDKQNKKGEWVGRTITNQKVKITNNNTEKNLTGDFIQVNVIKVGHFGLEVEI